MRRRQVVQHSPVHGLLGVSPAAVVVDNTGALEAPAVASVKATGCHILSWSQQQQHSSQLPSCGIICRASMAAVTMLCCALCALPSPSSPPRVFFFCLHSLEGVIYCCCLKIRNLVFAFFQILKKNIYTRLVVPWYESLVLQPPNTERSFDMMTTGGRQELSVLCEETCLASSICHMPHVHHKTQHRHSLFAAI